MTGRRGTEHEGCAHGGRGQERRDGCCLVGEPPEIERQSAEDEKEPASEQPDLGRQSLPVERASDRRLRNARDRHVVDAERAASDAFDGMTDREMLEMDWCRAPSSEAPRLPSIAEVSADAHDRTRSNKVPMGGSRSEGRERAEEQQCDDDG